MNTTDAHGRATHSLHGVRRMLCILVLALALSGLLTSPRPMLLAFVAPVRAES